MVLLLKSEGLNPEFPIVLRLGESFDLCSVVSLATLTCLLLNMDLHADSNKAVSAIVVMWGMPSPFVGSHTNFGLIVEFAGMACFIVLAIMLAICFVCCAVIVVYLRWYSNALLTTILIMLAFCSKSILDLLILSSLSLALLMAFSVLVFQSPLSVYQNPKYLKGVVGEIYCSVLVSSSLSRTIFHV